MSQFLRVAAFVIVATFSVQAAGCESASRSLSPAAAGKSAAGLEQQLIIKFKPGSVACTAQAIARFAKSVDASLEWLRPMSGDACVVIHAAATADALKRTQERLQRHPNVEWVEIDAPMQRH